MSFLSIDKTSLKRIISERSFQSTEYASGNQLANLLKTGSPISNKLEQIYISSYKGGLFLRCVENDLINQVIFDLDFFDGFNLESTSDILSLFQKTARTCLKYWDSIPLSTREWYIAEKDILVLNPKRDSLGDGSKSRVVINTKPDWERQVKRSSQHLLVSYYGPRDEQLGPPSLTNFKRAIDCIKECAPNIDLKEQSSELPLLVETFEEDFHPIDAQLDLEKWQRLLTTRQKEFVNRDNYGPERIEGAAGTGKTLSLSLRCCQVVKKAQHNKRPLKVGFLTHSQASKEYIEEIIFPKLSCSEHPNMLSGIELNVTTIQQWCIDLLGNKVAETELLDKDAQSAKNYQQMLISDVLGEFKNSHLPSFKKLISTELFNFFENEETDFKVQCLQFEIAEIIKGISSQSLSKYKRTVNTSHAVPLTKEDDYDCVFSLYSDYQQKIENAGYFDNDDIVLTALGQLDSPIWRRRKSKEGYDIVFLDETHLFNLNELSIIHHLLKDSAISNIIYSFDKSQSLGSLSMLNSDLDITFGNNQHANTKLKTVFRCSPEIVKLAFNILSSGSSVFTNLENPLDKIEESFTLEQESRASTPYVVGFDTDEQLFEDVFKEVDKLGRKISSKRSRIIIIATTEIVLTNIQRSAERRKKPLESISERGDKKTQESAEKTNKYIVSGFDYIGGLEFDGAVIVGADIGRLPATEENEFESRHFLNHVSYNRLYIALTRAKYGISMLYNKARGISKLLDYPLAMESIIKRND